MHLRIVSWSSWLKLPLPQVGSPLVFLLSYVYLQHVRKRDRRVQRLNIQQGLVMLLQFCCVKKQNVLHQEKNRSGRTRQNRQNIHPLDYHHNLSSFLLWFWACNLWNSWMAQWRKQNGEKWCHEYGTYHAESFLCMVLAVRCVNSSGPCWGPGREEMSRTEEISRTEEMSRTEGHKRWAVGFKADTLIPPPTAFINHSQECVWLQLETLEPWVNEAFWSNTWGPDLWGIAHFA